MREVPREGYVETSALSVPVLTRAAAGEIFVVKQVDELAELIDFTSNYVPDVAYRMFGCRIGGDLDNIHRHLTPQQAKQLHLYIQKNEDKVVAAPMAVARVLRRAGIDEQCLLSVQVHFRMHIPAGDGIGLGATPHRDSWYSLPSESLNVWMPCTFDSSIGVTFYPGKWRRKLTLGPKDNTSNFTLPGFDANEAGIVSPSFDRNDMVLFAGNHLHQSTRNTTDKTRVSWDYRVVQLTDLQPSLRLHQFVFADLFLERPDDLQWQSAETQRRLRKAGKLGSYLARGVIRRRPGLSQLIRNVKDAFPNVYFH